MKTSENSSLKRNQPNWEMRASDYLLKRPLLPRCPGPYCPHWANSWCLIAWWSPSLVTRSFPHQRFMQTADTLGPSWCLETSSASWYHPPSFWCLFVAISHDELASLSHSLLLFSVFKASSFPLLKTRRHWEMSGPRTLVTKVSVPAAAAPGLSPKTGLCWLRVLSPVLCVWAGCPWSPSPHPYLWIWSSVVPSSTSC